MFNGVIGDRFDLRKNGWYAAGSLICLRMTMRAPGSTIDQHEYEHPYLAQVVGALIVLLGLYSFYRWFGAV